MEIAFIPRWLLGFMVRDRDRAYHLNILLSNLAILVVIYLIYTLAATDSFLPNICLVDYFLGVECPFCGTTRSLGALYHGEVLAAWHYNRAGLLLGIYLLLQLPLRIYLLSGNYAPGHRLDKASHAAGIFLLLLFILNWIYNLIIN